jgi:transcriptional regulator of heat shock response
MNSLENAEQKGKKLGVLIASLKISAQEQEALLALLPQMDEEQLDRLSSILEASYLQHATAAQDAQLAEALQKIDQKFTDRFANINTHTNKQLDSAV